MRARTRVLMAFAAVAMASASCSSTDAVSSAIAVEIGKAERGISTDVWADVRTFYRSRNHAPAWVDGNSTTRRVRSALDVLRTAPTHGLPVPNAVTRLEELAAGVDDAGRDDTRQTALAVLDVQLTAAVLALGREVALGRVNPQRVDARWKPHRQAPDFPALLGEDVPRVDQWLERTQPVHRGYGSLRAALAKLRESNGDADRIRQVELNLDRWRWLPDALGSNHLWVNVPAYELTVREGDHDAMHIRVVVGSPGNETPIFSDEIETVVFSPYWNIPDSIVEGETAPAAARDANYLRRNNIEVLRVSADGVTRVDADDVDWDDAEALRSLAFRQRPGATNALGHVKFLFPNPYNVYLHDTPADTLFGRTSRALSHGCIRLEEPEKLAQYVLRGDTKWTASEINTAMHAGVERAVKLDQPLPVHIVYFTAWAGSDGALQFGQDVYGHDTRQARLSAEKR